MGLYFYLFYFRWQYVNLFARSVLARGGRLCVCQQDAFGTGLRQLNGGLGVEMVRVKVLDMELVASGGLESGKTHASGRSLEIAHRYEKLHQKGAG